MSLGQGQEVVAENALDMAAENGHWVILQVRGEGARAPGVGLPLGLSTRGDWPEGWKEGIRIHQPGWDSYSP